MKALPVVVAEKLAHATTEAEYRRTLCVARAQRRSTPRRKGRIQRHPVKRREPQP